MSFYVCLLIVNTLCLSNLFDQNNHGYNKNMNHNSDAHDAYKFKVKKNNTNQCLKG